MSLAATTAIPAMATRSARRAHLSLLAAPVGRGRGASVAVSLPKGDGRWAREGHGCPASSLPRFPLFLPPFPVPYALPTPSFHFLKVHKAYGCHRPYKAHADRGSDNRVRPLATHRIPPPTVFLKVDVVPARPVHHPSHGVRRLAAQPDQREIAAMSRVPRTTCVALTAVLLSRSGVVRGVECGAQRQRGDPPQLWRHH
jgi:hypothetical protein